MDTVPYQPGMTLGRTFDFKYMRPGIDIFTDEALAKSKIIDNHQTSITYSVVENNKDKKEALGVDGAMSLKVKAGLCNVKGIGEYLNTDRSKENTIEILARAHVETMTETMTVTIPTTGWQKNVTGSHYIRSITYGGDMIVSIRIQGSSKDHFNEIKAKVDAGLQTGGLIDVEAKGQFKKLEEELRSGSKISINYFSTTLHGMMPRDINGMLKALDNFNDQVLKSNEGRGVPLTCELLPLSLLDSSVPHVLKNKALEVQLTQLDDYYEDVLQAKATLVNVLEKDDIDLTKDQEENAQQLEECIDDMLTVFNKVIVNLDITSNSDSQESSQTAPAFEVYKKYKKKSGSYTREVTRFVKSLQSVQSPDANEPTDEVAADLQRSAEKLAVQLGVQGVTMPTTATPMKSSRTDTSQSSVQAETREIKENKAALKAAKLAKVQVEKEQEVAEENLKEMKELLKQSREDYQRALDEMPSAMSILGMSILHK